MSHKLKLKMINPHPLPLLVGFGLMLAWAVQSVFQPDKIDKDLYLFLMLSAVLVQLSYLPTVTPDIEHD